MATTAATRPHVYWVGDDLANQELVRGWPVGSALLETLGEANADVGEALAACDSVLPPGAPFHIHFSDIQYANRNETKHLPYGEGTLRADPLAQALSRFERPATVISESPDEPSSQAIRSILEASPARARG